MAENNWFKRNIAKRGLIKKNEEKVTYLQIIGFSLIGIGILYMTAFRIIKHFSTPEGMAISFFLIMLGMAFAFPSLLQGGDKEMSTMRIVVFMMVNVICLLLIKTGWENEIKSLKDIGLDQYWMGVIAFIFGAKATQAFFESRMAKGETEKKTEKINEETALEKLPLADSNVITEALKEKGKEWIDSFPYVTGLSIRNKISDGNETKNISLVFKVTKKNNELEFGKIPEYIKYTSKENKKYHILTDVVEEKIPEANAEIIENTEPFPLGNSISRKNDVTGSIGLVIQKNDDQSTDYIVSCYHVFCSPELRKHNKTFLNTNNKALLSCASTDDNGTNLVGTVVEGIMNTENDFAIAKVEKGVKVDTGVLTLGIVPTSFGFVFPENKGDVLTMCGRTSGIKHGRIKSHSASQSIFYFKKTVSQFFEGLIEVEPFSKGGDSGGVVINNDNKIIGLVIGGSTESSYVLPIKEFLLQHNYSLKSE